MKTKILIIIISLLFLGKLNVQSQCANGHRITVPGALIDCSGIKHLGWLFPGYTERMTGRELLENCNGFSAAGLVPAGPLTVMNWRIVYRYPYNKPNQNCYITIQAAPSSGDISSNSSAYINLFQTSTITSEHFGKCYPYEFYAQTNMYENYTYRIRVDYYHWWYGWDDYDSDTYNIYPHCIPHAFFLILGAIYTPCPGPHDGNCVVQPVKICSGTPVKMDFSSSNTCGYVWGGDFFWVSIQECDQWGTGLENECGKSLNRTEVEHYDGIYSFAQRFDLDMYYNEEFGKVFQPGHYYRIKLGVKEPWVDYGIVLHILPAKEQWASYDQNFYVY